MKKIFFLTLFAFSFSRMAISQTNTFYKSYPLANFYNTYNKKSINVLQTDDGGYIIQNTNEFKFLKIDQYGFIEYIKEYPHFTSASLKLIKTLDGGFAAVGNSVLDTNSVFLIKFDNNLDTLWTRGYPKYMDNESAQDVIQLSDSCFVFSSSGSSVYWLRKTNINGVLICSKQYSVSPSGSRYSYLVNLNDSDFLFWRPYVLTKFNADCDSLWGLNISSQFSYLTSDGHILVLNNNKLKKFDQNGNLIFEKTIAFINSITEDALGNYVYVTTSLSELHPSKVGFIDSAGNQVLEKEINDNALSIISCSDGGFIISGEFFFNHSNSDLPVWLLKTDNRFEYTALQLRTPRDSQRINIFNTYNITWQSKNVNFVNIDYSTDNQANWNTIIHYFPAEVDTFNWTIADITAGDLFIRISDSFNPDIFDRSDPPQYTVYYQVNDYIAANEIKMWMDNNGMNSHHQIDQYHDEPGFLWPGGENGTISAIYLDGLVWGGKVNGEIRVNGDAYFRYGLNPGYIQSNGLPSDPNDTKAKIFKLKKNWQSLPPSVERDRYEFDYLNWPVDIGAPWTDNNGDGIYTLGIDEPKIIGDETLFFVANDLDTAATRYTYGSNPIGLEFQLTTFGYNTELLKDVVFKKFKVINKSSTDVTDMYFTYWVWAELGNYYDDFIGCDTMLNLGYTYNADNNDEGFYGSPPPAVGHMFLQSPIVPAEQTDSARYDEGWKKGFKNVPVTAFMLYLGGSTKYQDPWYGYEGALDFYNNMCGYFVDGDPVIDPNTDLPTHFCVPGDPVTGTGWYEGSGWPSGPLFGFRRFSSTSGPFNIALGDTQEVVIAFLMKKGTDNISSVAVLKDYAAQIQHWYNNDLVTDVKEKTPAIPTEFSLSQNYPNPFNPSTTIKYTIPNVTLSPDKNGNGARVVLKVYDILGSEVATLVNEEQSAGTYEVQFNPASSIRVLASGIYFYCLQAGNYIETKKMLLLK
jgi:hypothetical protein